MYAKNSDESLWIKYNHITMPRVIISCEDIGFTYKNSYLSDSCNPLWKLNGALLDLGGDL